MMNISLGLSLTTLQMRPGSSAPAFSILDLFANGEIGVWSDPSDLPMFFQDVSGNIPSVYGGNAAANLDKSIGPVADSRSDWSVATQGTSAETATFNPTTGAGRVYRGIGSANGSAIIMNGLNSATIFYVEITNQSPTVDMRVRDIIGGAYVVLIPASTTFKGFLTGKNEYAITSEANSTGVNFTLSVFKEYSGSNAFQADAAKQPKILDNDGAQYLLSDLVDDSLPAIVPNLGSNATIAYATEAGVTILTGQTIGAGALEILRGEKTYSFMAINRALTGPETTSLTEYMNGKSGTPAPAPSFAAFDNGGGYLMVTPDGNMMIQELS